MQEKIESSEKSMEADKEEMIQQLRRGKTQALALMQVWQTHNYVMKRIPAIYNVHTASSH